MDKNIDLNFTEDNSHSVLSNNEDFHGDLTDYSTSLPSASSPTYNSTYHRNHSNYNGNYNNMGIQQNAAFQYGSSTANPITNESFKQYLDQLTVYLCKNDPTSLKYLEENIMKCRTGDIDFNETGRQTPLLFPEMHALAKLDFPGLIYQLIPNALSQTGGIITISDEIYPKYHDFQSDDYPGPLTLEKTTEEQIFYYLKDQMSQELQDMSLIDLDSGQLLISYLELLIKENGKPRISNVVRLLNEGIETKTANLRKEYKTYEAISRNSFSRASSRATSRASSRAPSPENIDPDLPQNSLNKPKGPSSVTSIVNKAINTASNDQLLCQNMDKYREYILSGRFEEAVNFAMRAGIWDHAFALALRMNNQPLVNEILIKFSRRAIFSNDPLFTMHELMAARLPRIVATNRGFSNSEMGDWRSHLSMILAVKKFRPEESRQSIESMGEKLMLLRSYFAAHLCFLLAGTSFGIDKTAHKYRRKFDLIGWSSSTSNIPSQKSSYEYCHKLFNGFDYWRTAPEKYIKLTEVYEYVLRLRGDGSHKSLAVHLLPYKYIMMFKMLSEHQVKNAYEYCRNIGEILGYENINWLKCESVNFRIISNLRDLSYKLHNLLNRDEDSHTVDEDITWLSNIDNVYCDFCQKYKLWNPKTTKPDFLSEQIISYNDDTESISDSASQVRKPMTDSSIKGNGFEESVNSANFHNQQPQPIHNQEYYRETQRDYIPQQRYGNDYQNNEKNQQRRTFDNVPQEHSQNVNFQNSEQSKSFINPQSYQNFTPNQMTSNKVTQPLQGKYNFSEVLPPSELPAEMIMNSPPRRNMNIRNTTGSNVDNLHFAERNTDVSLERRFPPQQTMLNQPSQNQMRSQFPTLPQKNADINMPSNVNQYQHMAPQSIGETLTGNKPPQIQPSMFMPAVNQDLRGSNETVDCFTHVQDYTRSRSQSNGSMGSGDSQIKPRSRNSSESKETKLVANVVASNRQLESTKEENEHQQKQENNTKEEESNDSKKSGWNPLGWLIPKHKGVHLPDDNDKALEYDSVSKKWIDKSNPQAEKPPTPPPKMPMAPQQSPYGNSFVSPGVTSPTLQKYRLAAPNVKPSANIPMTSLPYVPPQMAVNQFQSQFNNHDSFDGRRYSSEGHHYHNSRLNYDQSMSTNYDDHNPQQSYDSSSFYHNNYKPAGNE